MSAPFTPEPAETLIELAVRCLECAAITVGRIAPPLTHEASEAVLRPHRELVARLAAGDQS